MRFAGLQTELDKYGILSTTHRPSRALHAEPATQPDDAGRANPSLWGIAQSPTDMALALAVVIDDLDQWHDLTSTNWPPTAAASRRSWKFRGPAIRDPATHHLSLGEAYERLFNWLADYRAGDEMQPALTVLGAPDWRNRNPVSDSTMTSTLHELRTSSSTSAPQRPLGARIVWARVNARRKWVAVRTLLTSAVGALYSARRRGSRRYDSHAQACAS